MKTCQTCRQEKELDEFKRNGKTPDGYTYVCKACIRSRRVLPMPGLTAEDRRQRHLARVREQRAADPEYRARRLAASRKNAYGLSDEQYQEILVAQGGACAICRRSPDATGGRGGLQIDHCHETGLIRGLLCFHCNAGLGHFKHDTRFLAMATSYLEDPPVRIAKRTPEPRKKAKCGTISGYERHRRFDETPCEACYAARREYARIKRAQKRSQPDSARSGDAIAKCGTSSGYVAHYRRGEKPCDDCRAAMSEYQAAHRQAKTSTVG